MNMSGRPAMTRLHGPGRRQHGAVVLVMFMVLIVTGSTLFISAVNNHSPTPYLQNQMEIREQMALAKEALLAFALNYPDSPGRLPCPDRDNNGDTDYCNSSYWYYSIGRLPVSDTLTIGGNATTFPFNDYYADIDRQFWYSVSYNYRVPASSDLNSDVSGSLTLDGRTDYVAVIIAPGDPHAWQDRPSATTTSSYYLEGGNQYGPDFVNTYASNPENFNDVVLGITRSEIMSLATMRVAKEIHDELNAFYGTTRIGDYFWGYPVYVSDRYPRQQYEDTFNNAMNGAVSWFDNEDWDIVSDYERVSDTVARVKFDGCAITYLLDYNNGISRDRNEC